jgi:hypothetical protein
VVTSSSRGSTGSSGRPPVGIGERVLLLEAQVKAAHEALERIEALMEALAIALGFSPKALRDIKRPKTEQ